MIFIFISCCEKAHGNKEFSCENLKPCHESQMMTHYIKPWKGFLKTRFSTNKKVVLKKKDEKSVCVTQVYGSLTAQNVFQMSQEIKEKKKAAGIKTRKQSKEKVPVCKIQSAFYKFL